MLAAQAQRQWDGAPPRAHRLAARRSSSCRRSSGFPIWCSRPMRRWCSTARRCSRASAIPSASPRSRTFDAAFDALKARGLIHTVETLPEGMVLEGAGDCVFDAVRNLFWMGFGPRSDAAARGVVEETFGIDAVALELCDPRFYHMDTALRPLPGGEVLYFPGAFTAAGRAAIAERAAEGPADRDRRERRLPARGQCGVRRRHAGDVGLRQTAARAARRARLSGGRRAARRVPAQRRLRILPHVAARPAVGCRGGGARFVAALRRCRRCE